MPAAKADRTITAVRGIAQHPSVLYVNGAFRAPFTGELRHAVLALLRTGDRSIVVDLARVSRIDAAGIGQLVRAYNVAAAAHGWLRIVHATPFVREVLELVGLFDLLSGFRDVNNASSRRA